MPKNNENFKKDLEGFLKGYGFSKISTLDTEGKPVPDASEADQFKFNYVNGEHDYGTVTISAHGGKVTVYYNDAVVKDPEHGIDTDWTKFLKKLKDFSLRNGQMGFNIMNIDNLGHEMKKRKIQKEEEKLYEGYYGTKHTSYNDNTPSVKMIIKHNKPLDENDKRYRYIEKIFLENELGERVLVPSTKPSIGRAFARHLAEGGQYNDERWNHIKEIAEDIKKLGGFVRATKHGQFNESVNQIVNEAYTHYVHLRETIKRIQGSRGYNNYFENWQPTLMEQNTDQDYAGMFTMNKLDPRIESALPVLNKLKINLNDLAEANEFESWANSIIEDVSTETNKKIEELSKLLQGTTKIPVGADALNIKGQLENILVDSDDRDELFAELETTADEDPDNDAKPVIITWLQNNRNEEFYGDVLNKLGKVEVDKTEIAEPTKPVSKQQAAPTPTTQTNQDKAIQSMMPKPLEEDDFTEAKVNKPKVRNFVAKHAQKSGAGKHGKPGYQRHEKHKGKVHEVIDEESLEENLLRIKQLSGLK